MELPLRSSSMRQMMESVLFCVQRLLGIAGWLWLEF